MAELNEFIIPKYKPFYKYQDGEFITYVSNRENFKKGLKDYVYPERIMTEQQAREAKNMDCISSIIISEFDKYDYERRLGINGFKLIPE